jgi:hypothetical protein
MVASLPQRSLSTIATAIGGCPPFNGDDRHMILECSSVQPLRLRYARFLTANPATVHAFLWQFAHFPGAHFIIQAGTIPSRLHEYCVPYVVVTPKGRLRPRELHAYAFLAGPMLASALRM